MEIKFEFYVINYNFNERKCEMFNIFQNILVQEATEKAVKKYIRSPKNFTKESYFSGEVLHGWEAFVKELDSIISWQERGRCEYEISANEKFVIEISDILKDTENFESFNDFKEFLKKENKRYDRSTAFDCYDQAHANIECIAHEVIRQYKEQTKNEKQQ